MGEHTKRVLIGEGIALVAWLVIMVVCRTFFMRPDVYLTAILFGIVAFAVSAALIAYGDADSSASSRATTEVRALPATAAVAYFVVALVANTIFCAMSATWISNRVPIVVNVVLLAVTAIVVLGAGSYRRTAEKNVAKAAAETAYATDAASMVASLIARADAPEVQQALRDLKQDIDYSPNVHGPKAETAEQVVSSRLDAVSQAMETGEPAEKVVSLVAEARRAWRQAIA